MAEEVRYGSLSFDPTRTANENIYDTTYQGIVSDGEWGVGVMPLTIKAQPEFRDDFARMYGYYEGDLGAHGVNKLETPILHEPYSQWSWSSPHSSGFPLDISMSSIQPWAFTVRVIGDSLYVDADGNKVLGSGIYLFHVYSIAAELPLNTFTSEADHDATVSDMEDADPDVTVARLTATGPFLDAESPFGNFYRYSYEVFDDHRNTGAREPHMVFMPPPRSTSDTYGDIYGVATMQSNMWGSSQNQSGYRFGQLGGIYASDNFAETSEKCYAKTQTIYVDCQGGFALTDVKVAFWGSNFAPVSYDRTDGWDHYHILPSSTDNADRGAAIGDLIDSYKGKYHGDQHRGDWPRLWTTTATDVDEYEEEGSDYGVTEFRIGYVAPALFEEFYRSTGDRETDSDIDWAMVGRESKMAGGLMQPPVVVQANTHTVTFYKFENPNLRSWNDYSNSAYYRSTTTIDEGELSAVLAADLSFLGSVSGMRNRETHWAGEVHSRSWAWINQIIEQAEGTLDATLPYPRDHKAKMQKSKPIRMADLSSFRKITGDVTDITTPTTPASTSETY